MRQDHYKIKDVIQKMSEDPKDKTTIFDSYVNSFDILIRYVDSLLTRTGTSLSRRAVMRAVILLGNEATPTKISKLLNRTPRAIISTLDSLEKDGMIVRIRSKVDRRSVTVVVSEKGWKKANDILLKVDAVLVQAISNLSDEERESLRILLNKLVTNLPRTTTGLSSIWTATISR
jgi:DNA-binding MarR family transcriptional regulator